MLLRSVKLTNYGVYGGETEFRLTPSSADRFNRPIVLLQGKNGVGKTTFVEAIRIGLHGALALGDRISVRQYEIHLKNRIHRAASDIQPRSAGVELLFDYVTAGRKIAYRVNRQWSLTNTGNILETLEVYEDGVPPSEIDGQQYDSFLRELVPVSAVSLFFFDGERIEALAEVGLHDDVFAHNLKNLLGINLVERLRDDIGVYITRQSDKLQLTELKAELKDANTRKVELEKRREALRSQTLANTTHIDTTQSSIKRLEQAIASEGGWFAEQLEHLKSDRQRLEAEIELQTRKVQEMCSGLMPFSIAPKVVERVANQLEREREFEQWSAIQSVIDQLLSQLQGQLTSAEFWSSVNIAVTQDTSRVVYRHIEESLRSSLATPPISEEQVVMHVSEKDRQVLLTWLKAALTTVPRQFALAVKQLEAMQERLETTSELMSLVPPNESLSPLVEKLQDAYIDLGYLKRQREDMLDSVKSVDYQLEQVGYELTRIHERIAKQDYGNERLSLAASAQVALESYSESLVRGKLSQFEHVLVDRFNALCRKENMIDRAEVDASDFNIVLFRGEQQFVQSELSAGERQLMATATMWALREVSRLPLPVIIDTPLGRLDSDHRFTMINNYFPQVSHQVILLATDVELDEDLFSEIAPAVSHRYILEYDQELDQTVVNEVDHHGIKLSV